MDDDQRDDALLLAAIVALTRAAARAVAAAVASVVALALVVALHVVLALAARPGAFGLSRCDAADEVSLIKADPRPYKIRPSGATGDDHG